MLKIFLLVLSVWSGVDGLTLLAWIIARFSRVCRCIYCVLPYGIRMVAVFVVSPLVLFK